MRCFWRVRGEAGARSGAARQKATDLSEERLELDRGLGLELGEGAGLRRLVRPPADETDPMTEAPVLEAIEGDLTNELGSQRFPGEVAVLRPATGPAGRAAALKTRPTT